jgi:hypothetical protein
MMSRMREIYERYNVVVRDGPQTVYREANQSSTVVEAEDFASCGSGPIRQPRATPGVFRSSGLSDSGTIQPRGAGAGPAGDGISNGVLQPGHQVHEVVGGGDAPQRPVQRGLIQDVPRYDLDRSLHFGSEFVGIAGEAAEPHALTFETGDESATDVAAAPTLEDQGAYHRIV